jgi:hypothetical protein
MWSVFDNPKVFLPQLCCTLRDSPEVLKHIVGEKRLAMSERMVGADGGLMVSQRGLTQRAVRSAQAKPIALAPLHEDARKHDCIPRATELV